MSDDEFWLHADEVMCSRLETDEDERDREAAEELAAQTRADEHLAFLLEPDSREVNDRLHATRDEERNQ